jgi:ABC-2 type transport system permease protein
MAGDGAGAQLSLHQPLRFLILAMLVLVLASALGLTLGCSVGQTQIGLLFTLVLGPMIFFGCVYYPWSALAPQFPHLSGGVVLAALLGFDALFLVAGLSRFRAKAVS